MRKIFSFIKENRVMAVLIPVVVLLMLFNILLPEKQTLPDKTAEPSAALPLTDGGGSLSISEVMIKNQGLLPDEDGAFPDWIEIENTGTEPLDTEGWSLSDREGRGWLLPSRRLESGERLIVFASGKDRQGEELHTDFALSDGETLYLWDRSGLQAGAIALTETECGGSLCLGSDGQYSESLYPSPGCENSAQGYGAWQESLEAPGPLVINEVMTANLDFWQAGSQGYCDWVEIKNISSQAVLLSDYWLSDDEDEFRRWSLPQESLEPGESIVICCDDQAESAGDYPLADFALDSVSEGLYLSGPDGLIDHVWLRDIPYECSYGRLDGESGWFFFAEPSPGYANGQGYRRVSQKPEALSPDGVFETDGPVSLELSGPGEIYYSLDSSLPSLGGSLYQGPISLDKTCVVRAIAVEEGALPSRALTLTYIINEGHSLPVLSLVSDDGAEFSGMYSNGVKGMETQGSLALYEEGGSFTIPCGIRMHGETSLILPKKNMSVRFRGSYGQASLDYDIFGGGVTEFTNLILRAGQDFYSGIIRNELCQNLCLNSSDAVISTRSKYCVLYIDGVYSGIYALMEKTNEQLYASIAGVSRDSVTVIESQVWTNTELYDSVFRFCLTNDMSQDENYQHFLSLMDVDSLIDWILIEGYCANADLSYGNLRYCRSTENDGKWRLMFYDLDSTFLDQSQNYYNLLSPYSIENRQVSSLIGRLLKNEDFVHALLTRAGELLNGPLTNENTVAEIRRLAEQIEPEVERDYARFGMSLEKWLWNIDFLENFVADRDWRQHNIDTLCNIFGLSQEERAEYFGE